MEGLIFNNNYKQGREDNGFSPFKRAEEPFWNQVS